VDRFRGGPTRVDWLGLLILLGIWILLQAVILPRLGVDT
jgi:hypothetical protein